MQEVLLWRRVGSFWGPLYVGVASATATGAILVMLIDTMIPEAFEKMHNGCGPVAATGFLFAFVLEHVL